MDEAVDEEFQTLADLMDQETLRGDYFGVAYSYCSMRIHYRPRQQREVSRL